MVEIVQVSIGVSVVSGVMSLALLAIAVRAYVRTREAPMAFVAGAFTTFALKSFLVAYGLFSQTIGHEALELLDAVGDLATVFLLVLPIFVARPAA